MAQYLSNLFFEGINGIRLYHIIRRTVPNINDPVTKRIFPYIMSTHFLSQFEFIASGTTKRVEVKLYRGIILKTSIISPRNRLYFKVGSLSCRNLSGYGNLFKDIINFVALFCTFSIFSISLFLNGHHTELEYSICGLTIALYSKTKVLLSICMKFLSMTPETLNALLILPTSVHDDTEFVRHSICHIEPV